MTQWPVWLDDRKLRRRLTVWYIFRKFWSKKSTFQGKLESDSFEPPSSILDIYSELAGPGPPVAATVSVTEDHEADTSKADMWSMFDDVQKKGYDMFWRDVEAKVICHLKFGHLYPEVVITQWRQLWDKQWHHLCHWQILPISKHCQTLLTCLARTWATSSLTGTRRTSYPTPPPSKPQWSTTINGAFFYNIRK